MSSSLFLLRPAAVHARCTTLSTCRYSDVRGTGCRTTRWASECGRRMGDGGVLQVLCKATAAEDNAASSSSEAAEETFVQSTRARRGGGRGFGSPLPGSSGSSGGRKQTLKEEAAASNEEVYDRLIEVFRSKTAPEWRKLIAYSKQWPSLSPGVFRRIQARAAAAAEAAGVGAEAMSTAEDAAGGSGAEGGAAEVDWAALAEHADPAEEAAALRKLARKLKAVHEELASYGALVEEFRGSPSREWESMVVSRRAGLGAEFFSYLELKIRAAGENAKEQEALGALAAQLLALVEAHDRVLRDTDAMQSAAEKLGDLLQAESLQDAEKRIDDLAAGGRLDPALLLTMAKAYAGAKETDITREEVKDIMAHLYFKAKESFAAQAPPEVRILKFLLAVESPVERAKLLDQAFTAGPALSTADADYLSTTPQALLNTIDNVLTLYDSAAGVGPSREGGDGAVGGMASDAAALMNPAVIDRLRELQRLIRRQYM